MDFRNRKVLVTDGDSRQILPILHGLHQIGCNITTINSSKTDNGYTSRYPIERLLIPSGNRTEYEEAVLREIFTKKYDVLLALSDADMDFLTKHFDVVSGSVKFPFADRETFIRAYNKQITMETCMDGGIPCPKTKRESESLESFTESIGYPLVAKPRMACGSMGLKIVKSKEQLNRLIASGEFVIDQYVIQEYIPQTGKQINVHLFMDDDQQLCSGVVTEKSRWYPVDGGASCLCRTIHNDTVLSNCEKLLKAIDWRSYCEIELIEDPRDGQYKVMEINGRASASIKIMDLVGINVAEQMMQLAYGKPVTKYENYPDDIRMRRLSADTLWLLQAKDRFTRNPFWFDPTRTHEVTFSLKDPLPFFGTGVKLLSELGSYKKEMEKRKRT